MSEALSDLLEESRRAAGVPRLASELGVDSLCLFVCDPELHRFLPGPGFPQRLPDGLRWAAFLERVAAEGSAQQDLQCPFRCISCKVSAFLLDDFSIAAFLGGSLDAQALNTLLSGLRLAGALLCQEVHTKLAAIRASLSDSLAKESRELAGALSEAHDKLISSLHARDLLIEQVNRKEEQLHLAGRASGFGVWELNLSNRQISLSAEAATIFGLPPHARQLAVEDFVHLIHSEDRSRVSQAFGTGEQAPNELIVQFRLPLADGSNRWIESRAAPHDGPAGRVLSGLSLDITQRVLTQQALLRSEKLAAAGALAASIAHEINNPLAGLVNLVFLARKSGDMNQVHSFLETMESELTRLCAVARQSLAFYRESNRAASFDLANCIRELLPVLEKQIRAAAIVLRADIPANVLEIDGWPGEIKQAVSNLILNAAHASSPGSEVRLRVLSRGHRIRLLVGDHGHGISPEHLARIFEPFFTTRSEFGTGLGLWVTYQIIKKHHATVRLRTSADPAHHGTVFIIDFPAAGTIREFSGEPPLRDRWRQLSA
jgi:signal transduction histidine kinase